LWRNWWNEDWQGKPKYSEKTWPRATLSTTNPTRLEPGLNLRRRGGKPATNRLSYGAATSYTVSSYTDLCSSFSVAVTITGSSANKIVLRIKSFGKVHSVVLLIKHRDELCQGCQRSGINPEIRAQYAPPCLRLWSVYSDLNTGKARNTDDRTLLTVDPFR
jgi:hypothetical protein